MLSVQQRTPADLARLIEADKEEIAAVIRFLLDKGEIQMEDGMLQTKNTTFANN
jgi:ATP-dependent DNA helicase RecQ